MNISMLKEQVRAFLKELRPQVLWGQLTLTAAYALFLFEITELVGHNLLRIIFALGSFTVFSLMMIALVRVAWLRMAGAVALLLLVWSNALHFRYFGTTLQLGILYNIGFLPVLGSQIVELTRWRDFILLAAAPVAVYLLSNNLAAHRRTTGRTALGLLVVYVGMLAFQFVAETEPHMKLVRKYGGTDTRLSVYRTLRFGAENHSGSILQFGLLWRYTADYLRLMDRGALLPVPREEYPIADRSVSRPNIVVIQVEALDQALIGYGLAGEPVTPFLNRLAEENIHFTDVYAQHSSAGGTSDGEFSFLTSLYPLGYKGSLGTGRLNTLPSLPRLLKANGYSTLGAHGNSGSLYYRQQAFQRLGFDRLYFKEQLVVSDPDRWHALKDRDFFDQLLTAITSMPEPFFAFLITLSSHTPFDLLGPEDYTLTFDHSSALARNFFSAMRYVDGVLEQFYLQIQHRFPGTVFLIYGDHGSNVRLEGYSVVGGPHLQRIAAIYADPEKPAFRLVGIPGSSIDLGPTLLDLLGFERPAFWQGQSLVEGQRDSPVLLIDSRYMISGKGEAQIVATADSLLAPLYRTRKYLR